MLACAWPCWAVVRRLVGRMSAAVALAFAIAADLDVYVTGARHELLHAPVSRLLDFTCDGERALTSKAVRRRGAGRRGAPPASPDYRRSRSELSTTTRLLTDMVTAANAGVSRPSAATGTATAL